MISESLLSKKSVARWSNSPLLVLPTSKQKRTVLSARRKGGFSKSRHAAITVSTCSGSSVRPMNALPKTHNGMHCKAILSIRPYPWGKNIRNTTQPVARGTRIPHSEVQDRDTCHVPLYAPTHRSTRVYLLHSTESLKGTGAYVENLRNQDERGQATRIG